MAMMLWRLHVSYQFLVVGCVGAELLLGQPLFPGDSGVDQLVEIIKVSCNTQYLVRFLSFPPFLSLLT